MDDIQEAYDKVARATDSEGLPVILCSENTLEAVRRGVVTMVSYSWKSGPNEATHAKNLILLLKLLRAHLKAA